MSRSVATRGLAGLPSGSALLDAMYPAGSVVTINGTYASALSGATFPEQGAFGGSFLAFDKASTESAVFALGSFVPVTWRTVDLYLEAFNFTGSGGDVRWTTNVNSAGDTAQTIAVTAGVIQTVQRLGGQTYTLDANTVAGVSKYGATVVLSLVGGDGADTFDSDIHISSLHVVRVT